MGLIKARGAGVFQGGDYSPHPNEKKRKEKPNEIKLGTCHPYDVVIPNMKSDTGTNKFQFSGTYIQNIYVNENDLNFMTKTKILFRRQASSKPFNVLDSIN